MTGMCGESLGEGEKMDLKQLQYFVVSVDSGSFKKAAEILYTSQPHISKTIKTLEAELQIELLKRKSRGVEVTQAGRKVYECACRVLVEAGKIQNIQEGGDIQILCIAANSNDYLAYLLKRFSIDELKFQMNVQYTECSMEEIFQMVHRHTADLGFVHVDEKQMTVFRQMLKYRHLEFTELAQLSPCLFTGPKNPLYSSSAVTVKELRELDYIQMQDEYDNLSIQIFQGVEDYQYYRRRRQVLTLSNRDLMMQMLMETKLCTISCGIYPEYTAYKELHGIPIRGTENSITFGYVQRKRDGMSAKARQFTEYVRQHLPDTISKPERI